MSFIGRSVILSLYQRTDKERESMKAERENQELQVMDYMTWPVVQLAQHVNFSEEMFLACVKLARMTRYEFVKHTTVVEFLDKLSYNQRQQLRDFYSSTFDEYLPI